MSDARRALLILVVLASWTGTIAHSQNYEQRGEKQQYFPKGTFAEGPDDGDFLAGWYSAQLRAMGEPSLSVGNPSVGLTAYRFIWLRTFHHPIVARFVLADSGTGTLRLKMTDGAGGYSPGKLTMNSTFPLGVAQTKHILSLLDQVNFWNAPTIPPDEHRGCDGSEWILEGHHAATYHAVHRWSPRTGPVRELGLYLVLDIAKLDIPKQDIY